MPAPPPIAWRRVVPPVVVVVVVLSAFSEGYGFDRDELYFAMLKPAWGYVDQPPLTPLVAHAIASVYDGGPWLMRVPATLCAGACVLLTALIARELGGDAKAQAWTAWGVASTSAVTVLGHVFLTSTPDLALWPAICWCVIRAQTRAEPRFWVWAGVLAGLATYNKLLVGVLVAGIALGLALVGPRALLASRHLWLGVAAAVVIAVPNELYQVLHGWPELAMGRALSADNAASTRIAMWPLLILLFGPPLAVIWIVGLRALARDPRLRFLVVAFVVLVVFTFVGGTQPHYPVFLLPVPFAAGIVAMERHLGRVWGALFALNGAVSLMLGLPVLAVTAVGASPVPATNPLVGDSVGWPTYVGQIGAVYDATSRRAAVEHGPGRHGVVVYASNYGEAGSVHHYRPDIPVFSGQNGLYVQARPPDSTEYVVVVGGQWGQVRHLLTHCRLVTRLRDDVGVDNEEQGEPVGVCSAPTRPWAQVWPMLHHLD